MLLEVATSIGAVTGAMLAPHIATKVLYFLFGGILLLTAYPTLRKIKHDSSAKESDELALKLDLPSTYPTPNGLVAYEVHRVPVGFAMMAVAGCVSGLLGIGSGALKVLAMDTAMGLPIKVSSATSNFMIGVTAAASAGIYFWRGEVLPMVAAPIALGVLIGSLGGAKLLVRFRSSTIRMIFAALLCIVAVEMLMRGMGIF
jgi:uncharacterized membrane protein YfcA